MLKWRVLLFVAIAVIGAACSDTTEPTTSGAPSGEDVVFGQGEMPETIPAEFPLPAGSVVGSTMVITNGITEVVIRVSAARGVTAQFFDQGLASGGFVVDRSQDEDGRWLIDFSRDATKGTLVITEPTEGISQVVLRYNVP
ncbi:MAG: hypothetical protein QNJ81_07935 [Acidimicrobiia bacterium]|nr:hypothetical protein [Acidimicrobiia bacterium]